jgi:anti-sigma-K factor RskA
MTGETFPDRERLAAEYVLGTLRDSERVQLEAELIRDPELRRLVVQWEERLLPLATTVAPMEPSPDLWARIATATEPSNAPSPLSARQAPRASLAVRLWESLLLWRSLAAVAVTAVVMFAMLEPDMDPRYGGYLSGYDFRLQADYLRLQLQTLEHDIAAAQAHEAEIRTRADMLQRQLNTGRLPQPVLIATLQPRSEGPASLEPSPAFTVLIPSPERAIVTSVNGTRPPTNKVFQLWALEGRSAETRQSLLADSLVSLGLIEHGGLILLSLEREQSSRLHSGDMLGVSLEPSGGSPTNQPTGPIVFTGPLLTIEEAMATASRHIYIEREQPPAAGDR